MSNANRWPFKELLTTLVTALNEVTEADHQRKGWTFNSSDWWCWSVGRKWIRLDMGTCGHFLIARNGELFNIKSYGVPDYNKKNKADLGNIIGNIDARTLYDKRYNYLR